MSYSRNDLHISSSSYLLLIMVAFLAVYTVACFMAGETALGCVGASGITALVILTIAFTLFIPNLRCNLDDHRVRRHPAVILSYPFLCLKWFIQDRIHKNPDKQ